MGERSWHDYTAEMRRKLSVYRAEIEGAADRRANVTVESKD